CSRVVARAARSGSDRQMPPRPQVPELLRVGPFTREFAYDVGLTRHQLTARCWVRLFHDVFVHNEVQLTPGQRLQALRLAAPDGAALIGRSAAWLFGVWDPPPGTQIPLEIALPAGGPKFAQRGVQAHRLVFDDGDLDCWD